MYSVPLENILDSMLDPPRFAYLSTGCWRRYIGQWNIDDAGRLMLEGFETDVYDLVEAASLSGWIGLTSRPGTRICQVNQQAGFVYEPLPGYSHLGGALDWLAFDDNRTAVGMPKDKVERWREFGNIDFTVKAPAFDSSDEALAIDLRGDSDEIDIPLSTKNARWVDSAEMLPAMRVGAVWVELSVIPTGSPLWMKLKMPKDDPTEPPAPPEGMTQFRWEHRNPGICFRQLPDGDHRIALNELPTFQGRPRRMVPQDIFPDTEGSVHATWFSGQVRVVHADATSFKLAHTYQWSDFIHDEETILEFEDGQLVDERTEIHLPPEEPIES